LKSALKLMGAAADPAAGQAGVTARV
jgi:hypothetical protein